MLMGEINHTLASPKGECSVGGRKCSSEYTGREQGRPSKDQSPFKDARRKKTGVSAKWLVTSVHKVILGVRKNKREGEKNTCRS